MKKKKVLKLKSKRPLKKIKIIKKIIQAKKNIIKKPKEIKPDATVQVTEVTEVAEVKEVKRRRKKGTNRIFYFTAETEKAIVEYNQEIDQAKRDIIYNEHIKYPFEKLVENVFNTFKFVYFETSPLDVQRETVTHLVSNIQKFDTSKGKAFSYFSIVAKHYLIALNNSNYKKFNQHVDISEEKDENTVQLQAEDKYYKNEEMSDFMRLIIQFWENNVGKIFTKQRDLNIALAVIELLRNSDRIDAFNKKALYLYIREISNCKTQQITKILNRMRQYQNTIKKSYINDGIVNINNYIKC